MAPGGDGGALAERTVIERPPPGPARGKVPVPAWAAAAIGAVLVIGGLAWVLRRLGRRGDP